MHENPESAATQPWMAPFQSALPPLRDKDTFVWQKELVDKAWKDGQPQLLRCVSTIVMAVVAALDGNQILYDRTKQSPNSFGRGNALLPPDTGSTQALTAIWGLLHRDAASEWQRPDILGQHQA